MRDSLTFGLREGSQPLSCIHTLHTLCTKITLVKGILGAHHNRRAEAKARSGIECSPQFSRSPPAVAGDRSSRSKGSAPAPHRSSRIHLELGLERIQEVGFPPSASRRDSHEEIFKKGFRRTPGPALHGARNDTRAGAQHCNRRRRACTYRARRQVRHGGVSISGPARAKFPCAHWGMTSTRCHSLRLNGNVSCLMG
jgi:hypothetical protein